MNNPYRSTPPKKGCTNLASCIVASIFLFIAIATITILYFLLFKPTPPKISVDAVQFPTFSTSNATVSFTYFQYVTVRNTNRDMFTHFDSSLELVSGGENVGVVFIPAGRIYGGQVQHMAARFVVDGYPLPAYVASRVVGGGGGGEENPPFVASRVTEVERGDNGSGGNGALGGDGSVIGGNGSGGVIGGNGGVGPSMEIETRMKLVGRVKVLKVFTHKVESRIKCGVAVELAHGSVLGFHC
ncbi:hypothetical protein LIER_14531 [Lithospermum erythrorhizon]|uniref:Late embryogenesis abundant protein LEA-2 subgroup domain-containing protein n=1 Tax=Lithospermum erythrorhizon TaxID=34254 RepID=A0AAV3Q205_LITER